jgi:hypothetical protein
MAVTICWDILSDTVNVGDTFTVGKANEGMACPLFRLKTGDRNEELPVHMERISVIQYSCSRLLHQLRRTLPTEVRVVICLSPLSTGR